MADASPVVPKIQIPKLQQLKADAIAYRERLASFPLTAILEPDGAALPAEPTPEDLRLQLERRIASFAEWVKNEIAFNVATMVEQAVDAIGADVLPELADLGHQVDELLQQTEDALTPETAQQILAVFELGRALCNLVLALTKNLDQVTRTRANALVREFRGASQTVADLVAAITLEDDEGEGDDDEDGPGDVVPELPPLAPPTDPVASDAATPQEG